MRQPIRFAAGLLVLAFYAPAFAQESSSKQKFTPEKTVEKKVDPAAEAAAARAALFPYRHFDAWLGQRFIFLAGPKASSESTYDDFVGKRTRRQYGGRIAKVVAVEDFSGRVHLEFEMEDDHEHLKARSTPGKESLLGMALLADIENARREWQGKTLWCREGRLSIYDEQADTVSYVLIKKYTPVKVVDVVPGWNEEKPDRFVLETADGKRGFVDLNLSGTNVFKEVRHLSRFEHCFATADPRAGRKWNPQVWALIENGRIGAGMTAEEVRLSWGEPERIARTAEGETWTYPAGTLLFKNGVLASKQ